MSSEISNTHVTSSNDRESTHDNVGLINDITSDNISSIEVPEPMEQFNIAQVRMSQFPDYPDQEQQTTQENPLNTQAISNGKTNTIHKILSKKKTHASLTSDQNTENIELAQHQTDNNELEYASIRSDFKIVNVELLTNAVNIDENAAMTELMRSTTAHNNNDLGIKLEFNGVYEYDANDSDVIYVGSMDEIILEVSDELSSQQIQREVDTANNESEILHAIRSIQTVLYSKLSIAIIYFMFIIQFLFFAVILARGVRVQQRTTNFDININSKRKEWVFDTGFLFFKFLS